MAERFDTKNKYGVYETYERVLIAKAPCKAVLMFAQDKTTRLWHYGRDLSIGSNSYNGYHPSAKGNRTASREAAFAAAIAESIAYFEYEKAVWKHQTGGMVEHLKQQSSGQTTLIL